MSTNCLVKTLKSSIGNSGFPRLGYLKFIVKHGVTASDYNDIVYAGGFVGTLELEGDPDYVYFTNSGGTKLNPAQKIENYSGGRFDIVNNSNEDAILWVPCIYGITKLFNWGHQASNQIIPTDDDGEYFLPNLTYANIKAAGSLCFDYISNTALTFVTYFTGVGGHISHINELPNVTTVTVRHSDIEGSIEVLATHPTLRNIEITWTDACYGKLENLLVGLLNNGRTGTFVADFHGTPVTVKQVAHDSGYYTATFGTGTITVNDSNNNLYIQYNGTNWLDANGDIYVP